MAELYLAVHPQRLVRFFSHELAAQNITCMAPGHALIPCQFYADCVFAVVRPDLSLCAGEAGERD